jgi:hypothetical protein
MFDTIIEKLRAQHPSVAVEQLKVAFPGADDDGIWFFTEPSFLIEVQIESPNGTCPFLIETSEHDERIEAETVDEVVATLTRLLHLQR